MAETARCPTCRKPVEADRERRPSDFPFCSERCRLVDLHKWLSGAYLVPGEAAPVPEEEPPISIPYQVRFGRISPGNPPGRRVPQER